jgi:predicted acyltransferase
LASSDARPSRLTSVDALRGFDMLWIVGAGEVVRALQASIHGNGFAAFITQQLSHAPWQGFTFYDLVFPLFVFLVGLSIVLSLPKLMTRGGAAAAHWRVVRRFVLLFALGLLYNNGFHVPHWHELRLMGVLQRIALCYLFAALLFLHLRPRALIGVCGGLLVGYWALLTFVPLPGHHAPSLLPGANWPNYLDARLLPGVKYEGTWDPEGLLSTLPAVASCLLGVFAGKELVRRQGLRTALRLIAGGALLVGAGYLWGLEFPVIKKVWTSSFVLLSAGYSTLLLGLSYYFIDVRSHTRWVQPLVWVGANALVIYLLPALVPLGAVAHGAASLGVTSALGRWRDVVAAVIALAAVLLLAWALYRRRIYLRV